MPLPGFPFGHVAQICEEFLKFWLSDEHGKVQPCKLASVSWCELSNESFNEPFLVTYFVYWFAFPAQKCATLCQDTGTLRQSKLTAATLESIMVTHAHAMSIQLQLSKKLAKSSRDVPFNVKNIKKAFSWSPCLEGFPGTKQLNWIYRISTITSSLFPWLPFSI